MTHNGWNFSLWLILKANVDGTQLWDWIRARKNFLIYCILFEIPLPSFLVITKTLLVEKRKLRWSRKSLSFYFEMLASSALLFLISFSFALCQSENKGILVEKNTWKFQPRNRNAEANKKKIERKLIKESKRKKNERRKGTNYGSIFTDTLPKHCELGGVTRIGLSPGGFFEST